MLDLLLECVAHPDYEVCCFTFVSDVSVLTNGSQQIADVTFNVWYRLSEELLKLSDHKLDELFQPYIQRLIASLCVHCQFDEDTSPVSCAL